MLVDGEPSARDVFLAALPESVAVVTPQDRAPRRPPRGPRRRAARLCAALAGQGVVVDARPPDLLRFGFSPLFVSDDDAVRAADALAALLGAARA